MKRGEVVHTKCNAKGRECSFKSSEKYCSSDHDQCMRSDKYRGTDTDEWIGQWVGQWIGYHQCTHDRTHHCIYTVPNEQKVSTPTTTHTHTNTQTALYDGDSNKTIRWSLRCSNRMKRTGNETSLTVQAIHDHQESLRQYKWRTEDEQVWHEMTVQRVDPCTSTRSSSESKLSSNWANAACRAKKTNRSLNTRTYALAAVEKMHRDKGDVGQWAVTAALQYQRKSMEGLNAGTTRRNRGGMWARECHDIHCLKPFPSGQYARSWTITSHHTGHKWFPESDMHKWNPGLIAWQSAGWRIAELGKMMSHERWCSCDEDAIRW